MKSVIVDQRNANVKIEKYIQSLYPDLSYSTLQKAFRRKDIRANGKRVGRDYLVMPGDKLEIYIIDELLSGMADPGQNKAGKLSSGTDGSRDLSESGNLTGNGDFPGSNTFSVVYEDENILIVNKAQGIPVHPDKEQTQRTLIDLVRKYLIQKDGSSATSANFQPALCHRLDRNTGGLVIIAKNRKSHEFILEKLESREIKKYYQCLVKGRMEKNKATLKAYLWKDADKSRVFVSDRRSPGSLEIVTGYKVIEYDPSADVSRLEVELVTGRTHQIRAHLAFAGHPVIGDGKYGTNAINRSFGMKHQALWACKIQFTFSGKSPLDYLNSKEFSVEPGFVHK